MSDTDILIRRYLLGEVADEERERVEQQLLIDRRYFDRFLEAEESLTDEYVKGALIGGERERFESYFMTAPERRESTEFAETLSKYISRERALKTSSPVSLDSEAAGQKKAVPRFRKRPGRAVIALLAAAALILIFGAALLLIENVRLKEQLLAQQTNLSQQEQELGRQLGEQRERNEELARQLEQAEREMARTRQELTRLNQSDAGNRQSSKLAVVSLVLAPGLERSKGQTGRLYLPDGVQSLRLELKTDEQSYGSYRAELKTAEGKRVWARDNLRVRQGRGDKAITATLPARLLPEGDYLVTLSAAAPGGYEEISTYYFTVLRK